MTMLKMSGYPITNARDYQKHFQIYDLLRQPKEFVAFATSHFANLSETYAYCAAMAYTAVEGRIPNRMRGGSDAPIGEVTLNACTAENFWDDPFGFCCTCSPTPELLVLSEQIARRFSPEIGDPVLRKAMLISIAAFVFLEDRSTEFEFDLARVRQSCSGKRFSRRRGPFEVCFEGDGSERIQTLRLEPSAQAYICPLFEGSEVSGITTFRVEAGRRISSLVNRTVTLCVGEHRIVMHSGEHLYVNTVNGRVAAVLDKCRIKTERTVRNTGVERDTLTFDGDDDPALVFYGGEYMSSFDFSVSDRSLLYISNLRLCRSMCASPHLREQLAPYSELRFVEVRLEDGKFYLLRSNGELISNDPAHHGRKNVCSIEKVLRGESA